MHKGYINKPKGRNWQYHNSRGLHHPTYISEEIIQTENQERNIRSDEHIRKHRLSLVSGSRATLTVVHGLLIAEHGL